MLTQVSQNEMFFPDTELTRTVFIENMKDIAGIDKNVKALEALSRDIRVM